MNCIKCGMTIESSSIVHCSCGMIAPVAVLFLNTTSFEMWEKQFGDNSMVQEKEVDPNDEATALDEVFDPYEYISTDTITESSIVNEKMQAAEAFVRLGKYDQAQKIYEEVTSIAPQYHQGWCGLIISSTCCFTKRITSEKQLKKLEEYSKAARMFAAVDLDDFMWRFRDYTLAERDKNNLDWAKMVTDRNEIINHISQSNAEADQIIQSYNQLAYEHNRLVSVQNDYSNNVGNLGCGGAFCLALIITTLVIAPIMAASEFNGALIFTMIVFILSLVGLVGSVGKKNDVNNRITTKKSEMQSTQMLLEQKRNEIQELENKKALILQRFRLYE